MITRSEIYAKYGGCCAYCGAEFSVERNVDVTYSTAKIPRGINCGPAGRGVKDGSLS